MRKKLRKTAIFNYQLKCRVETLSIYDNIEVILLTNFKILVLTIMSQILIEIDD